MTPGDKRPLLRRSVLMPAALLALAAAVAVVTTRPADVATPVPAADQIDLTLAVSESIEVGQAIDVTIDGARPGTPIELRLDAGYGPVTRTVTPTEEQEVHRLEPMDIAGSGTTLLMVVQGDRTATAVFELVAGEPVDPIPVYLGGRTVVADPEHHVMEVAVPTDRLGNPVADGTPIRYLVTREEQEVEMISTVTEHLLSNVEVRATTTAGMVRIGVEGGSTVDPAGGPERTFLQVAGRPVPFTIDLGGPVPLADGHALLPIETDVILDRYGNALPDGILAYLEVDDPTGSRRLPSTIIDGRARFDFTVPAEPGTIRLQASVGGVRSQVLEVDLPSAVDSIAATARRVDDRLEVSIGRVRTVRGSYVPDGTQAVVESAGERMATPLIDGVGTAAWESGDALDATSVTVTVLGHRQVVPVER